jgi:hypothetical protein
MLDFKLSRKEVNPWWDIQNGGGDWTRTSDSADMSRML